MVWWIGAAGAVLFVAVFLVDGWTRPGYSPVRHTVSALALGPRGWVQTANFVVCGGAVTAGALALALTGRSLLLGISVGSFGLGLIASGVYRMDPMRGYPPGAPDGDPAEFTVSHERHDYAGAAVFFFLPFAAVVAAFEMSGWGWTAVSAAMALGLGVGFSAFGTAWENDSPRTGLVQRAVMVPGWLWLAAVFTDFALR